ncbi:Glycosyltransferase involved in cell wall bisynthesis [Flexibacter flexilis DSM 6793]|uniref:Glycosyltransferase involved in cell wall bisynthesis n=1 Tax=Flexibacter flexilis DSM 6793 TaxID=927664 RepID=A0A1I1L8Q0_9BACT|nr:glycosyltransferase family 4 protein [Flexibacter flexilis]SFC69477.1 Glycosyltransferase involved in cell wall bisynthesis [Flexibacter flexilis DSM 6793]
MKRRIVLASLLKPVNDTRMYEKFAVPIAQTNQYDVHVIGFEAKQAQAAENITFHTLFSGKRLSIKRLGIGLKYFNLLLKLKPEVIIVSSPDLLLFTSVHKIIFGTKILYDVQENYFANIVYTPVYPAWVRKPLGHFVRFYETILSRTFDHFILAEQCYEQELSFISDRYTIIENKFLPPIPDWTPPPPRIPTKGNIKLLYSGTIAEHYGIWEAIEIAKSFYEYDKSTKLTIIGYCAKESLWQELKKEISKHSFIILKGGNQLVPHQEILAEIKTHNIGLLTYQDISTHNNRVPTKYYEYLANNLSVLITQNKILLKLAKNNKLQILATYNTNINLVSNMGFANSYYDAKKLTNLLLQTTN